MIAASFCVGCKNWVDTEDGPCPVCKAQRERDEAMAVARKAMVAAAERYNQMERERYEALEENAQLREEIKRLVPAVNSQAVIEGRHVAAQQRAEILEADLAKSKASQDVLRDEIEKDVETIHGCG